jgi:phthiocerol/phenolphthiocerol synthesis type-I polyketide synthase C
MRKIAIIGHASRLPQSAPGTFWEDLCAGRNLLDRVAADRWAQSSFLHPDRAHPGSSVTFAAGSLGDVSGFDAGFFGISPREAQHIDPQQRLLLEMSWEALAHAGLRPRHLRGGQHGVFIGLASTDYAYRLADDLAAVGSSTATGVTASIAANRLSFFYDWHGPSLVVDTACSSGLVAFHLACRAIAQGDCELALTGAINLHLHPFGFLIFSKASMLSAQGQCRPFQEGADGYVRSEGGGIFVLKDLAAARRDGDPILAVVAGTGINADGHKTGLTIPRAEAQAALLQSVYAEAGIEAADLHYLEAHGTGTAVGDPIEVAAIGMALGALRPAADPLPIGSVKSNLGHLETASFVPSLLKILHSLRERRVPPTIGIERLNPALELEERHLRVVQETLDLPASGTLRMGVNSFGFGGANAHAILQSPPRWRAGRTVAQRPAPDWRPLLLSAANDSALPEVARRLREALEERTTSERERSLYENNFRRDWLPARQVLWFRNHKDVLEQLRDVSAGTAVGVTGRALADATDAAWVFSGNGCQWAGMGRELLTDAVFAAAIAEIDAHFVPLAGYSLHSELALEQGEGRWEQTQYAQPALFALQVGLVALLRAAGMRPAAVLGHSVGEVAAAWAAGALSLADAVRVIYYRSLLQEGTRGLGQMSAVALSGDALAALLEDLQLRAEVQVAAWNSPRGATAVGSVTGLECLETALRATGTAYKRLPLDYPFHGPLMDPLDAPLRAALAEIQPQATTVPFYSAVAGTVLAGETLHAEYWWRNIREPVRFAPAAQAVLAKHPLCLELGGHPVLQRYLQENAPDDGQRRVIVTSGKRGETEQSAAWRNTLAALWIAGVPAQWSSYFPRSLAPIALPDYPWERERHWLEPTAESARLLFGWPQHPLLGHPVAKEPGQWEQHIDLATLSWLEDHRVGDSVLFPGAGFAELLLALGYRESDASSPTLRIDDLELLQALPLEARHGRILRCQRETRSGDIDISSRVELDTSWTLHARGRVNGRSAGEDLPELPTLPEDGGIPFAREEHYARCARAGLHYGPAFQTVLGGIRYRDGVRAQILPPDPEASSAYRLHPTLLDGAFQLFAQLLPDESAPAGWGFVPIRLDTLVWTAGTTPLCEARIHLRRRSSHSLLGDLDLLDQDGCVRVRCRGLRLRQMRLAADPAERLRYFMPSVRAEALASQPSCLDGEACRAAIAATGAESNALWQRYGEEYAPLVRLYLTDAELGAEERAGIWRTLLEENPELLSWTLNLGRFDLARQGRGEARQELASVLAQPAYAQLLDAPSESLAAALATYLMQSQSPSLCIGECSTGAAALLPRLREDGGLRRYQIVPADADLPEHTAWLVGNLDASPSFWPKLDFLWVHADLRARDGVNWATRLGDFLRPGALLLLQEPQAEDWWISLGEPKSTGLANALAAAGSLWTEIGRWRGSGGEIQLWRYEGVQPAVSTLPKVACIGTWPTNSLAQAILSADGLPNDWQDAEMALLRLPMDRESESTGAILAATQELRRWYRQIREEHPQLRCAVLIPGALGVPDGAPESPVAAALAGLLRTLQNEFPSAGWQLLDLPEDSPAAWQELAAELASPLSALEVGWDRHGRRYLGTVQELPTILPSLRAGDTGEARETILHLDIPQPGQLRHLLWLPTAAEPLGDRDVEVDVCATGLNFRDLLYALGALPDEALDNGFSGAGLGLEFAGVVRRVGSAVTEWQRDQRVMGLASRAFRRRLTTPAHALAPLPDDWSYVQGATVPVAFFTAWYSLLRLAHLSPGERVLIHGAAGALGLAAIQLAQRQGAEIWATAGNPAKRDFLRLLGVEYLYDSRSLDFADAILRDSEGEGVDVILNSLSGEAIAENLRLLRPGGRFLELGKRDFYANTPMGLRPFRNNISYFGVDADQLFALHPALMRDFFAETGGDFANGTLSPLPLQRFPARASEAAFRALQQSRHLGKIVLDLDTPLPQTEIPARAAPLRLDPEGIIVASGGTNGFGWATVRWLFQRGARRFLLLSRSGQIASEHAAEQQTLEAHGAEFRVMAVDVRSADAVTSAFAQWSDWGPLQGVVHAAASIEDAFLADMDDATLERVLRTKIAGAENLAAASTGLQARFFLVYSSITTLFGNPGQAAYVAANAWLEAWAREQRQAHGLPVTAIAWGPIADAGFLTRHERVRGSLEERMGGHALAQSVALDCLDALLQPGAPAVLAIADLSWASLRRHLPVARAARCAHLDGGNSERESEAAGDLRLQLQELSEKERLVQLRDAILEALAAILQIRRECIDLDKPLQQMGLDSLMGMELALALEERLNVSLPSFLLSEGPSVRTLARRIVELLADDTPAEPERELRELASLHGANDREIDQLLRKESSGWHRN